METEQKRNKNSKRWVIFKKKKIMNTVELLLYTNLKPNNISKYQRNKELSHKMLHFLNLATNASFEQNITTNNRIKKQNKSIPPDNNNTHKKEENLVQRQVYCDYSHSFSHNESKFNDKQNHDKFTNLKCDM